MLLVTSFTILTLLSILVYATTMTARLPTTNQLSPTLPGPHAILTTHDPAGTTCLHSVRPVKWTSYQSNRMSMSVAYTTAFPANLTDDADITAHDSLMTSGTLGLVKPNGTVLRYVDIAPGYAYMTHQTQGADYGIVLEGNVTAVMGSGEEIVMGRGDVMVQRTTMHQWRNDSKENWVRMIFCLQYCQAPIISRKKLGEDLGKGLERLPESRNSVKSAEA